MSNIFIKDLDAGLEVSYSAILNDVKSAELFQPYLRTSSLNDLYTNLLIGLATGNDVTLIDSDFSDVEIENLLGTVELLQVRKKVEIEVDSMSQLLDRIESMAGTLSLFTSGTTGTPKKITHTVGNLARGVKISEKHIDDVWGLAYNPTHIAGLQVFFQALFNTNLIVNIFGKARENVFKAFESAKITHISATPTFFRMLLPADRNFTSVKRITFGGEKSDKKLHSKITALFPNARVTNIYASTEAGSILIAHGDEFEIKKEVAGKVEIRDNEIMLHRSLLGHSTDIRFIGEWYRTNDIVKITSEEPLRFKIVARRNEMINVGGYKVNPSEVEECMLKIEEVKDCRVYGKPNSVLGTILCAEYVLQNGKHIKVSEIKNNLAGELQQFKIPSIIKNVEKLEMTRTGKLKR